MSIRKYAAEICLRFESAPFRKELKSDNTLYVSKSKSVLRHVEIIGAGRGKWKGKSNATSAIETWGVPPVMEHILIENSAYNGKYCMYLQQSGGFFIGYTQIA